MNMADRFKAIRLVDQITANHRYYEQCAKQSQAWTTKGLVDWTHGEYMDKAFAEVDYLMDVEATPCKVVWPTERVLAKAYRDVRVNMRYNQ